MIRRPPRSPPFPYTPLFRPDPPQARRQEEAAKDGRGRREELSDSHIPTCRPAPALAAAAGSSRLREGAGRTPGKRSRDRKSTRLNSSHANISYAVFCLKKKN